MYLLELDEHTPIHRTSAKLPSWWEPHPSSKQNLSEVLDGRSHPFHKVDVQHLWPHGKDALVGQSDHDLSVNWSTDCGSCLDLPSMLAQPQPQPNVQLQGDIGSKNAANTNSEHVRSQPGTAENGLYPDSTILLLQQMEHIEKNEQGIVRRAETSAQSLISEKAAGKKHAESKPDGGLGGQVGERPQCRLGDTAGEQGSYDDEPSGYLAMYFSNLTSFEQSRVDVIRL